MQQWSDGIFLLGQYNRNRTGCWLLTNGREGAILELPPYNDGENSPAAVAAEAARSKGVEIKYIFCSHAHGDHISRRTLGEFHDQFPHAIFYVQEGFRKHLSQYEYVLYFTDFLKLHLAGEVLYLVSAPKHSFTDTMLVFRGVIFTGDWELNTIRSVHDGKGYDVPQDVKLESIERMLQFEEQYNYHIHKVFSVHANDRRENINFQELMEDTKHDRKLW